MNDENKEAPTVTESEPINKAPEVNHIDLKALTDKLIGVMGIQEIHTADLFSLLLQGHEDKVKFHAGQYIANGSRFYINFKDDGINYTITVQRT